jgi:preprotein translocase subunit SecY
MKTIEIVIQRVFFYGAFVLAAIAVCGKIANLFKYTLFKGYFTPGRLLEFAAIGLLFSIAMQLHQIRLLLSSKSTESPK